MMKYDEERCRLHTTKEQPLLEEGGRHTHTHTHQEAGGRKMSKRTAVTKTKAAKVRKGERDSKMVLTELHYVVCAL